VDTDPLGWRPCRPQVQATLLVDFGQQVKAAVLKEVASGMKVGCGGGADWA
jgi:hypothetical protein